MYNCKQYVERIVRVLEKKEGKERITKTWEKERKRHSCTIKFGEMKVYDIQLHSYTVGRDRTERKRNNCTIKFTRENQKQREKETNTERGEERD